MRRSAPRLVGAAAVVVLLAACGSSGSGSSSASGSSGSGGGLSETNVTISGAFTSDMEPAWVAAGAGFFKSNGLNVKIVNSGTGGSTASQIVAQFLGNKDSFIFGAANTIMSVAQSGVPLKAVYGVRLGGPFQITVSNPVASSLHIPSGTTAADTEKQLTALKGSHLKIAISGLTSPVGGYLGAILKQRGLTYGPGPDTDVQLIPAGSSSATRAAVQSGKTGALIGNPPNSLLPDSTTINLGLVQPLADTATIYAAAQTSFVQQHKDTVAAAVRAMTQAWTWAKANPDKAEAIVTAQYKALGTTDATTLHTLFRSLQDYWAEPSMGEDAYNHAKDVQNLITPNSLKINYADVVDSSFVTDALKAAN
ncbi:MAG TPA: ABC transporter substrate-binding protein [Mycobacteriales bacterium]|jgi:ABC-type nitrate/sulfonate/bicarbonate transport system substrate-binding protein|nr:ABC transporter substrate-binding protein [Mycobacteriales bacterium]